MTLDIDLSPSPPAQDAPTEPPRFTIGGLMKAIAVVGIGLGLVRLEPGLAVGFWSWCCSFGLNERSDSSQSQPLARRPWYAFFVGVIAPSSALSPTRSSSPRTGCCPRIGLAVYAFIGLELVAAHPLAQVSPISCSRAEAPFGHSARQGSRCRCPRVASPSADDHQGCSWMRFLA
ncbi:MAG: hypothetical protein U0835_20470 [Isosphaeraceae bacterium]